MNDTIRQELKLSASPDQVYSALLDSAQFSQMSGGAPAEIAPEVGGAFSCFGGHVEGRNVELVPGKRIVQAWRAKTWREGAYSVATFELKADGAHTLLTFDHAAFPEGQREHLAQGWKANYWGGLVKLFS